MPPGSGWGSTEPLGIFRTTQSWLGQGFPACGFGFQALVLAECWGTILVPGPSMSICLLNYTAEIEWESNTLFASFPKWYPVLFTRFPPFKFCVARCIASVAGNFSLSPKLKTSTELRSCWLHPWEQLLFKIPRWRRFVACFAVQAGNEYELKGLYLRAVSPFFFFLFLPTRIFLLLYNQISPQDWHFRKGAEADRWLQIKLDFCNLPS